MKGMLILHSIVCFTNTDFKSSKPVEYMQIDETFAPYVHRVNQAIRQRAIYPDSEIETIAELSTKWSNPPDQLISNAEAELKTLIEIAEVKKGAPLDYVYH